jgi:hypothetical protein
MAKKKWWGQWRIVLGMMVVMGFLGFGVGVIEQTLKREESLVLGAKTSLNTKEILSLLNLERAKKGLGPVNENEKLMVAAKNKGENMLALDYWAHVSPDGMEPWTFLQAEDYNYQSAGENLARDFKSENDLVAAWMASPTHRANILNGNYLEVGLAVLDGIIGDRPVVLVVNFFAQPRTNEGWGPVTAVYDQDLDSVILSGNGIDESWGRQMSLVTWGRWVIIGIIIGVGVGLVLVKLKQKPYGPKKKKRR